MSATAEQTASPVPQQGEPPCYEICLRTWTTDRDTAFDLAVQISESLADNDQVDATATTIGVEDEAASEREHVYTELVGVPPKRQAVSLERGCRARPS
jgi:hypothetical protein